jgi:hypothetical protein
MNDENQENGRPMILTVPAYVTVPGFGFLVALNPILPCKRGRQARHRASRRGFSVVPGEELPLTKGPSNSSEGKRPADGVMARP